MEDLEKMTAALYLVLSSWGWIRTACVGEMQNEHKYYQVGRRLGCLRESLRQGLKVGKDENRNKISKDLKGRSRKANVPLV